MLNFRTENKIALVTGCSSVIGMAIAIKLEGSGADNIGVAYDLPLSGVMYPKLWRPGAKSFIHMLLIFKQGIIVQLSG